MLVMPAIQMTVYLRKYVVAQAHLSLVQNFPIISLSLKFPLCSELHVMTRTVQYVDYLLHEANKTKILNKIIFSCFY